MLRLQRLIIAIIFATSAAAAQIQPPASSPKYPMSAAFGVRRNIWLFVRHSANGQVCEMSLEPRHWTGDTMIVDSELSRDEVLRIVEEVVPESERGKRHDGFPNSLESITGHSVTSIYEYDKLRVNFGGTTKGGLVVAVVSWPDRHCQADKN